MRVMRSVEGVGTSSGRITGAVSGLPGHVAGRARRRGSLADGRGEGETKGLRTEREVTEGDGGEGFFAKLFYLFSLSSDGDPVVIDGVFIVSMRTWFP